MEDNLCMVKRGCLDWDKVNTIYDRRSAERHLVAIREGEIS